MTHSLDFPFDGSEILRKKRSLKRKLLNQHGLLEKRIAILGGSTTSEVKDLVEIFLLKEGVKPLFYESEYNQFYEDALSYRFKPFSHRCNVIETEIKVIVI